MTVEFRGVPKAVKVRIIVVNALYQTILTDLLNLNNPPLCTALRSESIRTVFDLSPFSDDDGENQDRAIRYGVRRPAGGAWRHCMRGEWFGTRGGWPWWLRRWKLLLLGFL
ncbi:uncharacterized protein [Gossypium hirsutum]|uniref:Uncharacterized protein n=1 Tax=Gossypium hirsutum TaxID=3635 RepID=A0ABM3ABV1_GOSHI|nr:uncharacterized protein LOC121218718 [Gossypium hirsutum]